MPKKPDPKSEAKPKSKPKASTRRSLKVTGTIAAHVPPAPGATNASRIWHYSNPIITTHWTAKNLYLVAIAYFDWATDNPMLESKPFAYQGVSWIEPLEKIRVFTLRGLQLFAGITPDEWSEMEVRDDMRGVVSWIEGVVYQQKFEAAAADLLNANFIAKDLGLADRQELGGIPGQPLEVDARATLLDKLSSIAGRTGTN